MSASSGSGTRADPPTTRALAQKQTAAPQGTYIRCGRLAFRQMMEGKREDITDKPQAKTSSKSLLPTCKFLDLKYRVEGKSHAI